MRDTSPFDKARRLLRAVTGAGPSAAASPRAGGPHPRNGRRCPARCPDAAPLRCGDRVCSCRPSLPLLPLAEAVYQGRVCPRFAPLRRWARRARRSAIAAMPGFSGRPPIQGPLTRRRQGMPVCRRTGKVTVRHTARRAGRPGGARRVLPLGAPSPAAHPGGASMASWRSPWRGGATAARGCGAQGAQPARAGVVGLPRRADGAASRPVRPGPGDLGAQGVGRSQAIWCG